MKTLFLISACLFLPITLVSQNYLTVDNRPNTGAQYSSISAAVTAAAVGDVILIHPSATSYGNVTVNKTLSLIGLSHNPENSSDNQNAKLGGIILTGSATNSVVSGLEFSSITSTSPTDCSGITISNNKILSSVSGASANNNNWVIEGNIFETASVNPNVNSNGWLIKNNIFDNTSYALVSANDQISFINNLVILSNGNFANNATDTIIDNNIFILEGNTITINLVNSSLQFNNCLTRNTSGLTVAALNGNNNLDNVNPGFSFALADISDYYNNDYNVSGAAVNAGTDGTDLGVFGANFTFDVQGRPDDYPYMTTLNISNPSVPMGQNIDVTFTAEKEN